MLSDHLQPRQCLCRSTVHVSAALLQRNSSLWHGFDPNCDSSHVLIKLRVQTGTPFGVLRYNRTRIKTICQRRLALQGLLSGLPRA